MKNKLKYLVKMSIRKKMHTKWFLIANAIFLVLIVALANIDNIVKFFGGDFEKTTQMLVIDNANVYDDFTEVYISSNKYFEGISELKISKYDKDLETAKKEVLDDEDKIVLVIDNDEEDYLKAELISYKGADVLVSTFVTSSLNSIKNNLIVSKYNVPSSMLDDLNSSVIVDNTRLDEKDSNKYSEAITGVLFPIIILPFFMLSMFLIGMIGAEVNEEKTSKSMEIIISNVSPKVHFFSKVIAGNVFVLVQGLLLLVYCFIGVIIRIIVSGPNIVGSVPTEAQDIFKVIGESGIADKLGVVLPLTLILMIITFVGYSLVAGILASMTTNQEDYQQLQTPIILISLVGYYISMVASVFEGSVFIRVISYIPFISSVLSPVLLFLNQISIYDVLISIGLMVVTVWLLIKYGLRIYKVGILNYSSTGLWKKMFKAIKSK